MNSKPLILPILAFLTAAIALSLPIQIMMIYGHGLGELGAVARKLTTLNWLVIFGGVATAALIDRGSPYIRYCVPGMIAAVFVNNYFVASYGDDFSLLTATASAAVFAVLNVPLLHPQIRRLLSHPELRWWLRPRRATTSVPIFLAGTRRETFRTETFDLSETGVFVQLEPHQITLKQDESISLCLTLGTYSQVRCTGRIVRITDARGTYPAGVGVQFLDLPMEEKKIIRHYIKRFEEHELELAAAPPAQAN